MTNPDYRIISLSIVIGILATALSIYFLLPRKNPTPRSNITVAATIFPLADIARQVSGDNVDVIQLLPSGASPHSWTPTPQQVASLKSARAIFIISHGLDNWATESLSLSTDLPVIVVDKNIDLRKFSTRQINPDAPLDGETDHLPRSTDPHYWLTAPNAAMIATTISDTLSQLDPDRQIIYQQNLAAYIIQLEQLETDLQISAHRAPQKNIIAIHDAWEYFADQYGLNLVATFEPVEGQEPSISHIRDLQNTIKSHNIKTFFTEPQKQTAGAVRLLKEDFGLTISVLDPIGGVGALDSYINLMRANMQAVVSSQ